MSLASIPSGVICNGENNTPDLCDKLVLGFGTKYSVGANVGVGYYVEGSAVRFTFKGMNPSGMAYNGTTYGVRSDLAWAAYK